MLRDVPLACAGLLWAAHRASLMSSFCCCRAARSQAVGVTVRGSFAYVTGYKSDSLAVVNVSDPTSPSIVGSVVSTSVMDGVRDGPRGTAVACWHRACAGLSRSFWHACRPPCCDRARGACVSQAFDVEVSGNYAYVTASKSDSLAVVDVSNPASPSIVGHVSSSSDMKCVRDCSGCGSSALAILLRLPSCITLALTRRRFAARC